MTDIQHSPQTQQLLKLLGSAGFAAGIVDIGQRPQDGFVANDMLGIWVHADDDMVRLVVQEAPESPGYRLVLGRRGLATSQALQIIAVHTRAAIAERTR
jgi:hypothetical protein